MLILIRVKVDRIGFLTHVNRLSVDGVCACMRVCVCVASQGRHSNCLGQLSQVRRDQVRIKWVAVFCLAGTRSSSTPKPCAGNLPLAAAPRREKCCHGQASD